MGEPLGITERRLEAAGEGVTVVTLSVGNPQCLVLTDTLDPRRFERLGPALATHPAFPDGTNVELVTVETPQRLRILIWERGVGATAASGTGACASAVAAAVYGGAERTVDVVSPGGTQRVEWTSDGAPPHRLGRDHHPWPLDPSSVAANAYSPDVGRGSSLLPFPSDPRTM